MLDYTEFVKNHQLEGIAAFGHQVAGRVIGGDGERQDLLLAAIVDAHLGGKGIDQPGIPLLD